MSQFEKSLRLDFFSDGVMAIIITIMVLELPIPEEPTVEALIHALPHFLAYLLSFTFIGIYWNNHHHLLRVTKTITPGIMWANLHLLFWLSLIPFATAWLGDHYLSTWPTAFYGLITLCCAFAYTFLQAAILKHDPDCKLNKRIGNDLKGKASIVSYALDIIFAFFLPLVSIILYALVAVMWFIPDRRLEGIENH